MVFNYFYAQRPQGTEEHKMPSVIFEDKGLLLNCFSTVWTPYRAPRAASLLRLLHYLIPNFFYFVINSTYVFPVLKRSSTDTWQGPHQGSSQSVGDLSLCNTNYICRHFSRGALLPQFCLGLRNSQGSTLKHCTTVAMEISVQRTWNGKWLKCLSVNLIFKTLF